MVIIFTQLESLHTLSSFPCSRWSRCASWQAARSRQAQRKTFGILGPQARLHVPHYHAHNYIFLSPFKSTTPWKFLLTFSVTARHLTAITIVPHLSFSFISSTFSSHIPTLFTLPPVHIFPHIFNLFSSLFPRIFPAFSHPLATFPFVLVLLSFSFFHPFLCPITSQNHFNLCHFCLFTSSFPLPSLIPSSKSLFKIFYSNFFTFASPFSPHFITSKKHIFVFTTFFTDSAYFLACLHFYISNTLSSTQKTLPPPPALFQYKLFQKHPFF